MNDSIEGGGGKTREQLELEKLELEVRDLRNSLAVDASAEDGRRKTREQLEFEKLEIEVRDMQSFIRHWTVSLGALVGVLATVISVWSAMKSSAESGTMAAISDAKKAIAETETAFAEFKKIIAEDKAERAKADLAAAEITRQKAIADTQDAEKRRDAAEATLEGIKKNMALLSGSTDAVSTVLTNQSATLNETNAKLDSALELVDARKKELAALEKAIQEKPSGIQSKEYQNAVVQSKASQSRFDQAVSSIKVYAANPEQKVLAERMLKPLLLKYANTVEIDSDDKTGPDGAVVTYTGGGDNVSVASEIAQALASAAPQYNGVQPKHDADASLLRKWHPSYRIYLRPGDLK